MENRSDVDLKHDEAGDLARAPPKVLSPGFVTRSPSGRFGSGRCGVFARKQAAAGLLRPLPFVLYAMVLCWFGWTHSPKGHFVGGKRSALEKIFPLRPPGVVFFRQSVGPSMKSEGFGNWRGVREPGKVFIFCMNSIKNNNCKNH